MPIRECRVIVKHPHPNIEAPTEIANVVFAPGIIDIPLDMRIVKIDGNFIYVDVLIFVDGSKMMKRPVLRKYQYDTLNCVFVECGSFGIDTWLSVIISEKLHLPVDEVYGLTYDDELQFQQL